MDDNQDVKDKNGNRKPGLPKGSEIQYLLVLRVITAGIYRVICFKF